MDDKKIILKRVRKSKNNDVYHKLIPRLKDKPCYKRNKNCDIEHINMVREIEDKKKIERRFQC